MDSVNFLSIDLHLYTVHGCYGFILELNYSQITAMKTSRQVNQEIRVDIPSPLPQPYTCATEYKAAVLKYYRRMARKTQAQNKEIRALRVKYGRVNVLK